MWDLVELIRQALAALLLSLGATASPAAPADPLMCHLQDRRITESSGVAAGPGALWTHNDSGDGPRFFFCVGPHQCPLPTSRCRARVKAT